MLRRRVAVGFGMAVALLWLSQPQLASAQAGCCACTTCAASEAFACRDALDDAACATTCTQLGCSAHQFHAGSDCLDLSECFGDCCDHLDGTCGQLPQVSCSGGSLYFAGSFCDGSNCVAQPPTRTPTPTATATSAHTDTPTSLPTDTPTTTAAATITSTSTPTKTATAAPTDTHTEAPTATPTDSAPTATPTDRPEDTPTETPAATATPTDSGRTPTSTPTFTPTPVPDFLWIVDLFDYVPNLRGIPRAGVSYVQQPLTPSLQLQDDLDRFCTQSGLVPRLRLDLPSSSCENNCIIGIFPPTSTSLVDISHLPRLNPGQPVGSFDLLVDTRIPCAFGSPETVIRFPNAITYVGCAGDCDADGETLVDELVRGVRTRLGLLSVGQCQANDVNGDGTVRDPELLSGVSAALGHCDP